MKFDVGQVYEQFPAIKFGSEWTILMTTYRLQKSVPGCATLCIPVLCVDSTYHALDPYGIWENKIKI